jgi:hypothetical protein
MSHKTGSTISLNFTGMMKETALITNAVLQTNLRAVQDLSRVDSSEAVLELQQRFVRDYTAVLMQGVLTIAKAATNRSTFVRQRVNHRHDPLIIIMEP